jgi:hypothetical protein
VGWGRRGARALRLRAAAPSAAAAAGIRERAAAAQEPPARARARGSSLSPLPAPPLPPPPRNPRRHAPAGQRPRPRDVRAAAERHLRRGRHCDGAHARAPGARGQDEVHHRLRQEQVGPHLRRQRGAGAPAGGRVGGGAWGVGAPAGGLGRGWGGSGAGERSAPARRAPEACAPQQARLRAGRWCVAGGPPARPHQPLRARVRPPLRPAPQAADELYPGSPVAGQAFFITNQEPVPFWDFTGDLLEGLGYRWGGGGRGPPGCVRVCVRVCVRACVRA